MDNGAHLDFLCSSASCRARKNLSGSTSYFTERKARYSPTDFFCLNFLHSFFLSHFQVAMTSEPFQLVSPITPENVTTLVRLKIPRRNQNNVTFPNPHSPLQLASNPAKSFFTVLTLHHDSFSTQHFYSHSQHIVYTRQQHFLKVCLILDFSFTQLSNTKLHDQLHTRQ